ncbi:MAG: hypothetical protein B6U87_02610 [Candidatus Aenigmarchaeota archaeon ex4484_52]|nr:MAG: hypothetical protein B6U87_02610 [Candidatus Aenigmarchaeota archaeon ex4484_52]
MNNTINILLNKIIKYNKYGQIFCILMIFASVFVILSFWQKTGNFLELGMDFTGGSQTEIFLDKNTILDSGTILDLKEQFSSISENNEADVRFSSSLSKNSILIYSVDKIEKDKIISILTQNNIPIDENNIRQDYVSSLLSKNFLSQAQFALIIALIAMAIVIFISFRALAPSLAIMLAAICDIVFTIAAMNIIGLKLTLASLTGLLMLIGYSVDTDVLLTTRVLKRRFEGTIDKQTKSAIKTGLTMTLTTIVSLFVLYLFAGGTKIGETAIVIIIGLIADMPFTWFQNVGILSRYIKKTQ